MTNLRYIGLPPSVDQDVAVRSTIDTLLAQNLTQQQVDTLITSGLSAYATRAYVDQQDALLADTAYVDARDATRLKLAQRNADSGYAGLDANGRVDLARVPVASTQRWPKPFYSPSTYNATPISTQASEVTLYTLTVPDPGWSYKLLIYGMVDTLPSADGTSAVIRVRAGSTLGQVVAYGTGSVEGYNLSTSGGYTTPGTHTYNIPSTSTVIDVVAVGGGGAGAGGGFYGTAGGGAGHWNAVRLTRGTNIPQGTTTLTATVGGGGVGQSPPTGGTASTVTGAGMTTLTAAAGTGGGNSPNLWGASPGNYSFQGVTYTGGAEQHGTGGGDGHPPGGGGYGGGSSTWGPGAPGAVWISASIMGGVSYSPAVMVPTDMSAQTPRSGATILYVQLVSSSSVTVQGGYSWGWPGSLWACPIPA